MTHGFKHTVKQTLSTQTCVQKHSLTDEVCQILQADIKIKIKMDTAEEL